MPFRSGILSWNGTAGLLASHDEGWESSKSVRWLADAPLHAGRAVKLTVLNPGGRDPAQNFPDGAGAPDERAHPPVNYHAYAACTRGAFFGKTKAIPDSQKNVLLVLRRDLHACLTALNKLLAAKKIVAVSIKESGLHQVAALFARAENVALLEKICTAAHGAISSTPDLVPLYRAAGAREVAFIPTPYPVEDPRWDFSIPAAQRRGIFIGTREFDVPSRNHAAALLLARELGEPITVMNCDGRVRRKFCSAFHLPPSAFVDGPLPYPRYLALVAKHKIVFQLDRSSVPGQVAGDALLCKIPCVGGDSALERVAFPELCGHGRDFAECLELARQTLPAGPGSLTRPASAEAAREQISFSAVAKKLEAFFQRLAAL